ncbi:MAG TPA: DUF885 family protein [Terracidiphilus sp.]|jgi:uncharacterized protein (DUF885 family)
MRFSRFASVLLLVAITGAIDAQASSNLDPSVPPMRALIERFSADQATLQSVYTDPLAPATRERMVAFYRDNRAQLVAIDFNALDQEGKADFLIFSNYLTIQEHQMALDQQQWTEVAPLLPYSAAIFALEDERRQMKRPEPQKAAAALSELTKAVAASRKELEAKVKDATPAGRIHAWRAAADLDQLAAQLQHWFDFSNSYDPAFTWWAAQPYKQLSAALKDQAAFLREKVAGIAPDDKSTVIGTPIGREALVQQLQDAMIPYSPEELITMAKAQLAADQHEMVKASREMGYGDDWRKALEAVKNTYVDPGKQAELIRSLALDGEKFAEDHNLVTIPPLAKETWRMEMMSPERQLVSPFFLGGDTILVSYPTDAMTYDQRMMSMRGNNPAFSHATVFHELIPGHWLQQFMNARYRPYRQLFSSGFWLEGNAFYWEMRYWDLGYDQTPEQRIGALFWRMHRSARIIFSLSFHLGTMNPQQAIDFLVTEVGHERDNATAEVRRSVNGDYDPLYQCSYMLGALEFRALRHELVDSGKRSDRQYNDAILQENMMPIPVLRALLTGEKLTPDWKPHWRFLDEVK